MIHVAIVCAKSTGRTMAAPDGGCPEFHATLAPDRVEEWAEDTLRESGWHVDGHDAYYCPAHNPTDAGTPIALIRSQYRSLGASGWEARLPDSFASSTHEFDIEIRPQRAGEPAGSTR